MGRWVGFCLALGAVALFAARFVVVPERDSWHLVVGGSDGTITVVRFTISNTGLLANEETTRVAVVRDDNVPLDHRSIGGPGRIDEHGIHGTADALNLEAGVWKWAVQGDAMRSAGSVTGQGQACGTQAGSAVGFIDVPNFSNQAAEGGLLRGPALVFRTLERGNAENSALYAVSAAGAVFLDPNSRCPAWLDIGGRQWSGAVDFSPPDSGAFDLTFGPHVVTVRPGERFARQGPEATTLLGERLLAWAAGFPLPSVVIRSVRVSVDGAPASWGGVLVRRGFE